MEQNQLYTAMRFYFLYVDRYVFGAGWVFPDSHLPYAMVRYILRGSAEFVVDGRSFLVHEGDQEEDDDRTRIYHSTEMDGAIQYGHPGKKPPLWLHGIMKNEMKFFNGVLHGEPVPDEFKPLMTGQAARAAIATADAATLSLREDRKVRVEEITGGHAGQ